jgi:hypothetical protein
VECVHLNVKFEADAECEATEEDKQPVVDQEHAAILKSCQLAYDERNASRTPEQADQQLLQRAMVVSHERLPTEEAGRLLS